LIIIPENYTDMKLLTDTEEQVVSGPTLGTLQLGISQDNFRLAMEILMDLYTQPIDSIMRELCSNAVDAMKQAGNGHLPIEVTLSSQLSPNLVVKDYGLGMSAEFITSTYCNLLSSTKRDDNDEIGGYGIGSKSPLGYTDSYTLSTRHAGTELHVHVSRNGGFVLLGSNPTTEASGTTVTVPVKADDCKAFADAISWLRYMSPPPLVNGKPIPQEEVLLEGEGWFIAKHDTPYVRDMQVLLGPIPYYLDTSSLGQLNTRQRCVATAKYFRLKLPIGSISVTPSRETLRYDEHTVATIKQALDDAYLRAMMAIKRLLESYEWAVDAKSLCDRQQFSSWFRASNNPSYYDKYTDSLHLPNTEQWYKFTYSGSSLSREKAIKYPSYGLVEVFLHDSPQRSRMRMEAYLRGKPNTTLLVGPPDSQVIGMKLFPTRLLSTLPDVVRDDGEGENSLPSLSKKVLQRLDRGSMRARLWQYNANPDGRLLYAHTADTTIPLDGYGYYIVMHAGNAVHPDLYEHRKLEYNNIQQMRAVLGITDAPLYVVSPQGKERLGTGYKDIITTTHEYLSPWLPWIKQIHKADTMARTFYGTNEADWVRYRVGGYLLEYLKLATEVENLLKGKPYGTYGVGTGIIPGVIDLYQYYLPTLWDAVPALPTNPLSELCYLVDKVYPLVHYMSRGSNDMQDYLQMIDTLLEGAGGWYSSCKLTEGLPQPTMGGRELMEYYYQRFADVRGYYERHG
jgi:hypothetical protein